MKMLFTGANRKVWVHMVTLYLTSFKVYAIYCKSWHLFF